MTCEPWTPLATGAVKLKVSSEWVVGWLGLRVSEPAWPSGDEAEVVPLVDAPLVGAPLVGVSLPGVVPDPARGCPALDPPQPATAADTSSSAAPIAGTRTRMLRANFAIGSEGRNRPDPGEPTGGRGVR